MKGIMNTILIIAIVIFGTLFISTQSQLKELSVMSYEEFYDSQKVRIEVEGISETEIRSEYRDIVDVFEERIIPREKRMVTTVGTLLGVSVISLAVVNYKLVFRKSK